MAEGDILGPYNVRRMVKEDIPQAVEIWAGTGLAEGTHTIATWFEVDPNGFYVAATDEGELYGTCAAVVLNDNLAFVGLYAVKPRYQGQGVGMKIWKKCMEHVKDRNAGLNSVPERLHTYRDLAGFSIVPHWQSVVCESPSVSTDCLTETLPFTEVRIVDNSLLLDVIRYDSSIHGFSRSKIVSLTVREQGSLSMAALQNGVVCGYGCLKKNIQGSALVGPLYADSLQLAELLLRDLIMAYEHAQKNGVTIMIIECNEDAMRLARKLNLNMDTKAPRCYLKQEVQVAFGKATAKAVYRLTCFYEEATGHHQTRFHRDPQTSTSLKY